MNQKKNKNKHQKKLNLPSKKLNDEQRRKKRKQVMSLLNFNTQIKAKREYLMSTTSDS